MTVRVVVADALGAEAVGLQPSIRVGALANASRALSILSTIEAKVRW